MNEHIQVVSEQSFDGDVLQSDQPVLVDFWAPWCGPCRILGPIIDSLAEKYAGTVRVAKVNVDEAPQVASRYGIMSIPTVMLFRNGKPEEQVIGLVPEESLSRLLDRHLAIS